MKQLLLKIHRNFFILLISKSLFPTITISVPIKNSSDIRQSHPSSQTVFFAERFYNRHNMNLTNKSK